MIQQREVIESILQIKQFLCHFLPAKFFSSLK